MKGIVSCTCHSPLSSLLDILSFEQQTACVKAVCSLALLSVIRFKVDIGTEYSESHLVIAIPKIALLVRSKFENVNFI